MVRMEWQLVDCTLRLKFIFFGNGTVEVRHVSIISTFLNFR